MRGAGRLLLVMLALLLNPAIPCLAEGDGESKLTPTAGEKAFLDRLMRAESGGRRFAKNPASSALGPYQFLETTFLDVVRRTMPAVAGKPDAEILQLRTDPAVARDAALIYTRENASALAAKGVAATAANLRLAFFAGAGGAIKVLQAKPEEAVSNLLSAAAIEANPFLKTMTAGQLIARAEREASGGALVTASRPAAPASNIAVRCNLKLVSCRKWLALAEKRGSVTEARVASARR
jgi:hypothetical protein